MRRLTGGGAEAQSADDAGVGTLEAADVAEVPLDDWRLNVGQVGGGRFAVAAAVVAVVALLRRHLPRHQRQVVGALITGVLLDEGVQRHQASPRQGVPPAGGDSGRGEAALAVDVLKLGRLLVHHQVGVRVVVEVVPLELLQLLTVAAVSGALVEDAVLLSGEGDSRAPAALFA